MNFFDPGPRRSVVALARALRSVLAGSVYALASICVLLFCFVASASAQSTIQITAPPSGTAVAPGATVTVSVSLGAGLIGDQVFIAGDGPIGFSNPLAAPPYQFQLTIPTAINAGIYHLTALAGAEGQIMASTPITIDVEPSLAITSFTVRPNLIRLRFVGDTAPLTILGTLSNGSQMDLTASTRISYTSANTSVAQVNTSGLVTATGAGSTSITINGLNLPFAIPVFVPSASRGDLNGDGKVNEDDLNILLSALNTPATKPFDARDLNADGVINALDARILVTLCSLPACATH